MEEQTIVLTAGRGLDPGDVLTESNWPKAFFYLRQIKQSDPQYALLGKSIRSLYVSLMYLILKDEKRCRIKEKVI